MKESSLWYWNATFGLAALVVSLILDWNAGASFFVGWTVWAFWKARHELVLEEIREIKERLDK